jgi:hypothetical protein
LVASRGFGQIVASWLGAGTGLALIVVALTVSLKRGGAILDQVDGLAARMQSLGAVGAPLIWIGLGLMLRVVWVIVVPAQPVSDGATYLHLAERLLSGKGYEAAGTLAMWPPGYPMFLAPWLALPASPRIAVVSSNLALFLLGSAGLLRLGRRFLPEGHVRLAVALYAVWPNLVFQAGLPEKELLLVALLPWVLHFWIHACSTGGRRFSALAAGALLGVCCLVQPGLQYLPAFLGLHGWASALAGRHLIKSLLLLSIGMASVVSPWTVRNALVLGEFVPIATNAGSVLYRANNPLATGAYTERGLVDLSHLGEVEADRAARRLAKEWIVENPAAFLRLGLEKQLLFMGDDAVGAYHSLRRGKNDFAPPLYFNRKSVV